jgi:hypothetical protein
MTSAELNKLFKQWCKETKRGGGVLVGRSIKEFFKWVEEKQKKTVEKQ